MPSASAAKDELTLLRDLVSTLQATLEETRKENALLRQKVEALVRRVFGASSERVDPAQLELLLQLAGGPAAPSADTPTPTTNLSKAPQPERKRVPRIPEDLPVIEQVIEPEQALA